MRTVIVCLATIFLPIFCFAQAVPDDISPAELQSVISLPLNQAVKQREQYKAPLKSAYDRQIALTGKDCEAESKAGQQPYNICIGKAEEQADKDFSVFYRNLQMLCRTQDELASLQTFHKAWFSYKENALKGARTAWSGGSGASGFMSQVYLSLVRDHMRELHEIYGLNVAQ